jgi:hypothetical protein
LENSNQQYFVLFHVFWTEFMEVYCNLIKYSFLPYLLAGIFKYLCYSNLNPDTDVLSLTQDCKIKLQLVVSWRKPCSMLLTNSNAVFFYIVYAPRYILVNIVIKLLTFTANDCAANKAICWREASMKRLPHSLIDWSSPRYNEMARSYDFRSQFIAYRYLFTDLCSFVFCIGETGTRWKGSIDSIWCSSPI